MNPNSSTSLKTKKREWTVRLFLPSLYTIILPPEGRNSKKTASCTTSSVYVNISKNSLFCHTALFSGKRLQRYIVSWFPPNVLAIILSNLSHFSDFLTNLRLNRVFSLL